MYDLIIIKENKEGDTLWVEGVTSDVKGGKRGRGKHKRKKVLSIHMIMCLHLGSVCMVYGKTYT